MKWPSASPWKSRGRSRRSSPLRRPRHRRRRPRVSSYRPRNATRNDEPICAATTLAVAITYSAALATFCIQSRKSAASSHRDHRRRRVGNCRQPCQRSPQRRGQSRHRPWWKHQSWSVSSRRPRRSGRQHRRRSRGRRRRGRKGHRDRRRRRPAARRPSTRTTRFHPSSCAPSATISCQIPYARPTALRSSACILSIGWPRARCRRSRARRFRPRPFCPI